MNESLDPGIIISALQWVGMGIAAGIVLVAIAFVVIGIRHALWFR